MNNTYINSLIIGISIGFVSIPLQADTFPVPCTVQSKFPKPGMTIHFCYDGNWGIAATESAVISTANNISKPRAIDFARREAKHKARASLGQHFNNADQAHANIQTDANLSSSEKNAWMALFGDTRIETIRNQLAAGVMVIAAEEHDGTEVHVTVFSALDTQD